MREHNVSSLHSFGGSFEIGTESYQRMSDEFLQHHANAVNVFLHMLTTPVGLVGAVSILRWCTASTPMAAYIVLLYLLSLLPALTNGVYIGTAIMCACIVYTTRAFKLSLVASVAIIIVAYALQDLAHMGVGEETLQSAYSGKNKHIDLNNPLAWLQVFLAQAYYLLPLCIHATYKVPIFANMFSSTSPHWSWLLDRLPEGIRSLPFFGYILTPLVTFCVGGYCIDSKNTWCLFPGAPYFHRVLFCNIASEDATENNNKKDLSIIRNWVMKQNPPSDKSSHWWYYELKEGAFEAFDRCAKSSHIHTMFRKLFSERHYCVDIIHGMNEVYVTGPNRKKDDVSNSDNVFYTRHVDGPWGFVPFVSVYRCIVGMDKNMMITTHFPLAKVSRNACEGDVLAFDFNREVHYIECDDSKRDISDDFRVVLKLHYSVYPRFFAPLGWLMHYTNVRYNQNFRALFLKTIAPNTLYEHFLAWNVNSVTSLFDWIETNVGLRNVIYLLFLGALWYCSGSYTIFFILTSFVHYLRYISTFYIRRGVDFGSFKRDVLLFKTLALSQLFYHYLFPAQEKFQFSAVSVGMILSGYGVSLLATKALGIDRTYFAAELGLVEPKWITAFPYGYIPHPMIVSQVWALLGFHMAPHFRAEWPIVVPIHCLLYITHMLQEHFDIYDKSKPVETNKKLR